MIVIQDPAFEPEYSKKEAYHAAALGSIAAAFTRLCGRTVSLGSVATTAAEK
jgi:hypothetical protein